MIRHILLFRFNEGVPQEVRDDATNKLTALGEQCPTVDYWSVGANIADSKSAFDMAEVADFEDEEALQAYKEHPAHRELAEHLGTIATWALVDYEFTAEY
jgi:hypothetical protein